MTALNYLVTFYRCFQTQKREHYISRLVEKGLKLGNSVDIVGDVFFDPSHCFLISIGDNCTICPNVRLIAHDASTKKILGYTKIGKIDIKNNCFIGDSAIVLLNVAVGPNSIVGAGAVVTKNVPAGVVVAGNPARVITTVQDYKTKISSVAKNRKIFNEYYFIENLDEIKRRELVDSLESGIGFIL